LLSFNRISRELDRYWVGVRGEGVDGAMWGDWIFPMAMKKVQFVYALLGQDEMLGALGEVQGPRAA
jgi:hypothetical protein